MEGRKCGMKHHRRLKRILSGSFLYILAVLCLFPGNISAALSETEPDQEITGAPGNGSEEQTAESETTLDDLIMKYYQEAADALGDGEEVWEDDIGVGSDKGRLIAHAGMSGQAALNSLTAFQLAGSYGYWGIEADLRWSQDHVLLCFHDESLDRNTNGSGKIAEKSWKYIHSCYNAAGNTKIYGAQPVCSFEDYLDVCRDYGCTAVIDVKYCSNGYKKMLRAAYDMVAEKEMLEQAVFQCSVTSYLEYLRGIDPDVRLWLLCGKSGASDRKKIRSARSDLGCEAVSIPSADSAAISCIHSNDMLCVYYQTDDRKTQEKLFAAGVDLVMENGKHTD